MTKKFDTFKQIEALEAETHQQRYTRKPGDKLAPPSGYTLAFYEGYWYPLLVVDEAKHILTILIENGETVCYKLKKTAILFCYQHKERTAKPYTCFDCDKPLSFPETFWFNGLTYCSNHLPEYAKESEGW